MSFGVFRGQCQAKFLCLFLGDVIGICGSVWLYCLALIGHNKGTLALDETLAIPHALGLHTVVSRFHFIRADARMGSVALELFKTLIQSLIRKMLQRGKLPSISAGINLFAL